MFGLVVALVGLVGGALAALSGAGIGSTLVPLLALRVDFKVAVAAAAVPHLVGSTMRAFMLWRAVDRTLLLRFGLVCAGTSLAGAFIHNWVTSVVITYVFAALLVLVLRQNLIPLG
jgi:uncharacterized membrane protein YfcA